MLKFLEDDVFQCRSVCIETVKSVDKSMAIETYLV